ncbi:MAG TPA: hypothetical protein VF216_11855 [Mizugakiibacter sp.]
MFKLLGALLAIYVIYAIVRGEVYAKAGARGRVVSRAESPEYFWVMIACYIGLSVALATVF